MPVCQRVSSEVGLDAIDPMDLERVGQGLIVHPRMLANPRVIAALLNWLSQLNAKYMALHTLATSEHF